MPETPRASGPAWNRPTTLARWAKTVRDKPVFLFLHLYEPHAPYAPPEPFRSRYADRPYDGEIAAADAGVGRLLDYLGGPASTREPRSCSCPTTERGWEITARTSIGVFLYRETLRVPLLWKRPGSANAGEVVRAPVGLADIAPTILSLVSEKHPGSCPASLWT